MTPRLNAASAVLGFIVLLTACTSTAHKAPTSQISKPSVIPLAASQQALPTCGPIPASNLPPQDAIGASLYLPHSGPSGQMIKGFMSLTVRHSLSIITYPGAELYIVYHGQVVGRGSYSIANSGLRLSLSASPTKLAAGGWARGCPDRSDELPTDQRLLPAGTYQVIGVTTVVFGRHAYGLVSDSTDYRVSV